MLVSFSALGPLRNEWYAVARSDEVQDGPLGVELLREELVLWRGPANRVIATPDVCSHRRSNLSPGVVRDGCLICPHHGRVFGEGGRCVEIPRREVIEESAHLRTYRCEERQGLVWVSLGCPRSAVPLAGTECASHPLAGVRSKWKAPAPRILEGLLRQGMLGDDQVGFELPFTYSSTLRGANGLKVCLIVACSPVGALSSLVLPVIWSEEGAAPDVQALRSVESALDALRSGVESSTGMYEIDEEIDESGTDPLSEWRRAFILSASAGG
jgi:nitrite reductase/ring-hydroxylating ferredoxin subunit